MEPQTSRICSTWRVLCVLLFVQAHAALAQIGQPAFAVATVKAAPGADPNTGSWSPPNTGAFFATHVSLALLLQLAYGVDNSQIVNKPDWLQTNLYDVRAKPENGILLSRDELKPRLQELLRERFHLLAHVEVRSSRGYALVVAKGGPHLTPTKAEHFAGFRINVSPGEMRGQNWSMPIFAKYLTSSAGFPVVDQTGIVGSYDIGFSYAPERVLEEADSALPSLGEALKKAAGLVLKPQLVPVKTVVIDSVDKTPEEN